MTDFRVFCPEGFPEVSPGDDVAQLIAERVNLETGDVVVVAQKIVSKAEGRVVRLSQVNPGARARELAGRLGVDPRLVQVILDESRRVVRAERVLIVETRQGFVCANAGVDHSNVPGEDAVSLLPEDCDLSARAIREGLRRRSAVDVAVIVSDTFGRAWRSGLANVALGVCGMTPLIDHRGRVDDFGRTLTASVMAAADELASAAELAMGKTGRRPVAVVRGLDFEPGDGSGQALIRPPELDLFR